MRERYEYEHDATDYRESVWHVYDMCTDSCELKCLWIKINHYGVIANEKITTLSISFGYIVLSKLSNFLVLLSFLFVIECNYTESTYKNVNVFPIQVICIAQTDTMYLYTSYNSRVTSANLF